MSRDTLLRHQKQHSPSTLSHPVEVGHELSQANITVSNRRDASGVGIHGGASTASGGLLTSTPSSFSSEQMHSTSRSDGFQSTDRIRDHAELAAQQSSVPAMNETLLPVPVQCLGSPFDYHMANPMEPSEMNLDFDWGQEFSSWFMESTADVQTIFSPFATDVMQPACSAPIGFGEHFDSGSEPNSELECLWFTHVEASDESHLVSGTVTPAEPREEVDEHYRQTMRRSLQIRPLDTSLPSPDFINLCIRLYFIRFHPKFPVIHVPTFQPSKKNSMLLLSICSIGSLITGTADGLSRGTHIWKILNKAILAKWERLVSQVTDDGLAVLQAALLGQTFALVSGDPKLLAAAEAFHGTLISVARRSGMFQLSHREPPQLGSSPNNSDVEWRAWAREEELIRTSLGLYIHDAELAHIYHHEPLLRPSRRVSCAASDELFAARNPREWLSRLHQRVDTANLELDHDNVGSNGSVTNAERVAHVSKFTGYVQLECISTIVLEERLSGRLDGSIQQGLEDNLVDFHNQYLRLLKAQETSTLEMEILWHLSFISLCTDFDLLERVVGRDGPQASEKDREKVTVWAASPDAQRATMHVRLLRQKLDALSIGLVPAIHIPRAIFFVAVCCYCAFRFSADGVTFSSSTVDFPELILIGTESNTLSSGRLAALETKEILCHLADILQRLGHWGIARKFGAIVEALLRQILI